MVREEADGRTKVARELSFERPFSHESTKPLDRPR